MINLSGESREVMNQQMVPIWADAQRVVDNDELDVRLHGLAEAGIVALGGAVVFAAKVAPGWRPAKGESLTGVEAGLNKVFLDELVDTDQQGWAASCIGQGVLLANRVFHLAALATGLPIDVALSADLGGPVAVNGSTFDTFPSSTFRFYVRRDDDPWMSEDLEGFDQPVALIRSS